MPDLLNNPNLTDKVITDILNYIRNGFGNSERDVRQERVAALRNVSPQEGEMYTEAELNKFLKVGCQ